MLLLLGLLACGPEKPSDGKPVEDSAPPTCDTVWYADIDGDGFGDPGTALVACEPPGLEIADGTDCDDRDAAVYPGAPEDCTTEIDANCDGSVGYEDADADGTAACEDCDDADPTAYPGAAEFCDGVDDDCDSVVDNDPVDGDVWFADADLDGFGDLASSTRACEAPAGTIADFTDCDDLDPAVNPDATETCNTLDDDCDGTVDEGSAADAVDWYEDDDGDGFGEDTTREAACEDPYDGGVLVGGDCDDAAIGVFPGAVEVCNDVDDDCSGEIDGDDVTDPTTYYLDRDADGWGDTTYTTTDCEAPSGYVAVDGDCDDTDPGAAPDAEETCDEVDDDCDGDIDEDDATDAPTWYADADSDTWGDAAVTAVACEAPTGMVASSTDCDDTDATVSPDGAETCDGEDDDCDGETDEDSAVDALTWYADADGDGWGDAAVTGAACAEPTGFVADATDCDDADPDVSPGGTELCDGVDDDCDGVTDEDAAADAPTWYADADADGYGDPATGAPACAAPTGRIADARDCDDDDDAIHPGAAEPDCDDPVDYNCDGSVGLTDADGDGAAACEDCDDAVSAVFPGAPEACNDVDDDCDGTVDGPGAIGSGTWYADTDGDGFGDPAVVDRSCELPTGFSADATDCDDEDAAVSPDGDEVCATSWDDDCDGDADELGTSDCTRYYLDFDEDGYGSTSSMCACDAEDLFTAADADDCDDGDADVNPGATEVIGNAIDDDCDGVADAMDLADAAGIFTGDAADDGFGLALDGGDVNGDGAVDVVIGAYREDSAAADAGAVFVFSGAPSGDHGASDADAVLLGEAASDYAGYSLAVGDLDGDGTADLLVGAYQSDRTASGAGAAYLVYGPLSGTTDLGAADATLLGVASGDSAGIAVAMAGDVDGDGTGDLLVGATASDTGARSGGSAYLLLGAPGSSTDLATADAELYGDASSDGVGAELSTAGDTDGDGYAEILLGVPSDDDAGSASGTAYLFGGPTITSGSLTGRADAWFVGEAASDRAGGAVAGAGDTDGDGYGDVIVGAASAGTGGCAYLVLGPFAGRTSLTAASASFCSDTAGTFAGYSVAGVGDSDGDGLSDVLVGGYTDATGGTDAGAAWLFSGAPSGEVSLDDASVLLFGAAGDRAGSSVAAPGDTDGDGLDDLLVGAFQSSVGVTDAGAAYLVR